MSISAFKCERGIGGGECPLLREIVSRAKPMEAPRQGEKQLRVLHVEDLDLLRRIVARVLGRANAEVVSANSRKAALGILEKDRNFDVIVLDFDLGEGQTGAQLFWELPKECRENVVFFSGEGEEKNLEKIYETGRPLVDKGQGAYALAAKIREMVSRRY